MASDHIRSHKDEFIPFLVDDNGDMLNDAGFSKYCDSIVAEDPVAWGGQPEVTALTSALKRKIIVHSASAAALTVGDDDTNGEPLQISFHKHYFGLGSHYNAVQNPPEQDEQDFS
jgi:OTU domain-containing protein 6